MDGQNNSPHDLYARLGTAAASLVMDVRSVALVDAFRVWLRIAALSFGGPTRRIVVMHLHNVVIRATILAGALVLCMMEANIAMADRVSFSDDTVGASPKGWTATMTGKGNPNWTVEEDPTARSKAKVVKQSGTATYPLLLKDGTSLKNGFVEIWFRAISGSKDRAAGIVWRARDADNYYVVRANALEDNVVAYKTVNGARSALDIVGRKGGYGIKVPVPSGQWHALRVEFAGSRFKVIFNGKPAFEVEDGTFSEAGQIGLWTKADSVTAFDDVSYGATR